MCSGPAKSTPVWEKGGSSETLSVGKSGGGTEGYGSPSIFLQTIHA